MLRNRLRFSIVDMNYQLRLTLTMHDGYYIISSFAVQLINNSTQVTAAKEMQIWFSTLICRNCRAILGSYLWRAQTSFQALADTQMEAIWMYSSYASSAWIDVKVLSKDRKCDVSALQRCGVILRPQTLKNTHGGSFCFLSSSSHALNMSLSALKLSTDE